MTGNEYQILAMRTNDGLSTYRLNGQLHTREMEDIGGIVNGCLGLSGEVGEFNDLVKKWIFHNADFEETHLMKEAGDIFWYLALICDSFGWTMEEIMEMNIEKLEKRYPDGFSAEKSAHRQEGDV